MSTAPLFGYGSEATPRKGRPTLKRGANEHERWAEAILPADAEAGVARETETNKRPLLIVAGLMVAAMGILVVRLVSLQLTGGERNLSLANGNRIRQKVTRAPRGVIYDRDRGILARNTANFDLTVVPALLPKAATDRQALYTKVAGLTGLSAAEVAAKPEADTRPGFAGHYRLQPGCESGARLYGRRYVVGIPRLHGPGECR
jgi:hypothetical protein